MKLMQINMKKMKRSVFHYGLLFFFLLGLVFFFLTPYIFPSHEQKIDSGVGMKTVQSLDNSEVKIEQKRYDPNENLIEFFVSVDLKGTKEIEDLDYLIEEEKNQVELASEKIKVNETFYVFIVKNVPKNWSSILFSVAEDEAKSDGKRTVARYTFTKAKMKKQTNFVLENRKDYRTKPVEIEIKKTKKHLKEVEKNIVNEQEKILLTLDKIEVLNEDKIYQTTDEKSQTDNKISIEESNNERSKKLVEDLQKEQKELNEKIQLLEKKIQDLDLNS